MNKIAVQFIQAFIVLIGIVTMIILIRLPLSEGRAAHLDAISIYTDKFILFGYFASIAFFAALYHAFKLLGYIGRDKTFSMDSVKSLRRIKYSMLVLIVFIALAGGYIRLFHDKEDDPAGFLALCLAATIICLVIATAATIFEKILQNAIHIKSENDLTI